MNSSLSPAVLFDIDGTLVDSNYLHISAWSRAFGDVGVPVDCWRIHAAIGMDSDLLLTELLGDARSFHGDDASQLHEKYYLEAASGLRVISGARELLSALAQSGVQVVLATSAPEKELQILRALLNIDSAIVAATTSADVARAKPAPDIVQVALARAGVRAADAMMVGDSVWDMRAAVAAGVQCIGLLSGGTSAYDLAEAGAAEVYDDVAHLLAALDSSALGTLTARAA